MSAPKKFLNASVSAALCFALSISGCSSTSDATWATAKNLLPTWARQLPEPSNPNFQYLRISIEGRSALLVLGEIDQHPLGDIESWYSGQAEVIKLQNGRIVGSAGLTTNWVSVNIEPIDGGYQRTRDVMPGYRFGLKDVFLIRPLSYAPPEARRIKGLTEEKLKSLSWVEEAPKNPSALGRTVIGYRQFDQKKEPVSGYQCLDDGLCLGWERL